MHPINPTHARTQPLLFFAELCIFRIIPNLNQRIAKTKQTNKREQKNGNDLCDYHHSLCGMPFSEVSFFEKCRKTKKKTEPP